MDAELCRLIARATQSPYFRREGELFAVAVQINLDGNTLADWLIAAATKAYSFEQLPVPVQGFLRDCDRSWRIEQELFAGLPYGDQVERDRQVLERMEQAA